MAVLFASLIVGRLSFSLGGGVDIRRVCDVTRIITSCWVVHPAIETQNIITICSLPNILGQITMIPKPELR